MKMIFKSTKSKLNKWVFGGSLLSLAFLTIPVLLDRNYAALLVIVPLHLLLISLLIWTYKATFYQIEGNNLHWKSGPFNGKIAVTTINKIEYQ